MEKNIREKFYYKTIKNYIKCKDFQAIQISIQKILKFKIFFISKISKCF